MRLRAGAGLGEEEELEPQLDEEEDEEGIKAKGAQEGTAAMLIPIPIRITVCDELQTIRPCSSRWRILRGSQRLHGSRSSANRSDKRGSARRERPRLLLPLLLQLHHHSHRRMPVAR